MRRIFAVGAVALCWITNANGQEDNAADLAKTLSNPVADLISIPFQFNYNDGIGPVEDGSQAYLNFQRSSLTAPKPSVLSRRLVIRCE